MSGSLAQVGGEDGPARVEADVGSGIQDGARTLRRGRTVKGHSCFGWAFPEDWLWVEIQSALGSGECGVQWSFLAEVPSGQWIYSVWMR